MTPQTNSQYSVAPVESQEGMSACFALRAKQYSRYYRNIPNEFSDEFDFAVCPNGFRLSQMFGVFRDGNLVGTCRLIRSMDKKSKILKSEVCELFDLNWSHLAAETGVSMHELSVAELGRFAVAEGENSREIKWMLLSRSGERALEQGIPIVIAIMLPTVERAARQAGVFFNRLNGVRLRRDDPFRKKYLLRYRDYFLPLLGNSRSDIDYEHLADANPIALDMLLSGASDGPSLWWIRSEALANSRLPSKETNI